MQLPSISINTQTATARRWAELQKRVQTASKNSPNHITVIATTRGLMADPVLQACEAGVTEFCEDYLPEGITKKPVIVHRFPTTTWHFTGSLQPNKLHLAVEFFDWIHMFDRETLLKPLNEAFEKHPGKKTKILIEVNPIGTMKKNGVSLQELPKLCDGLQKIPQAKLMGLSCRSELMMSENVAAKAYDLVKNEQVKLIEKGMLPKTSDQLAMGSSRDLEKAIQSGSTMLRIGSALFGKSASFKAILPVDEF